MYKTTFANYQKSKNILVLKNFYNLMKPRVMSLVVFTAFVGLIISNKQIDFITSASLVRSAEMNLMCSFFISGGLRSKM